MTEDNFGDRRSCPRISVVCPVAVKGGSRDCHGIMRNLSTGGAAIEISESLEDNKQYTLEFILPDGPELKASCEIMWKISKDKDFMYGLRFISLGMFGQMKLNSYMAKHLPAAAFEIKK
jgi:hypothetical protein